MTAPIKCRACGRCIDFGLSGKTTCDECVAGIPRLRAELLAAREALADLVTRHGPEYTEAEYQRIVADVGEEQAREYRPAFEEMQRAQAALAAGTAGKEKP
jgi:hypothetical protein